MENIKVGDKVVPIPYISCGNCIACRNGKTNCCTNIQVLGVHIDGGFQENFSLPTELLLPSNHLSYDQMTIVEPLAIGAHAVRRSALNEGEFVVVMGCGPIGIGIIQFAQLRGAKVIAVDIIEERLQFVKEHLGVNYIINGSKDPIDQVNEITKSDRADAVF